MESVVVDDEVSGSSQYDEQQICGSSSTEDVYASDVNIEYTDEIVYEDENGEINIHDVRVEEIVDDADKWIIPMGQQAVKPEPPLQKSAGKPRIVHHTLEQNSVFPDKLYRIPKQRIVNENGDGDLSLVFGFTEYMGTAMSSVDPTPPCVNIAKCFTKGVLRTVEDLRMRPRVDVNPGRSQLPQWEEEYDHDDGPSGTPSMRNALRMYSAAALRKADEMPLLDIEDEEFNQIEREVEEDKDDETHVERDISKRNQVVFNHKHWPLYWDRPVDFQEACDILCGAIDVAGKLICSTVPQQYKMEGTFVIDLRSMTNRHHVHSDSLGSWGKPTGRVRFYARHEADSNRTIRADDGKGHLLPGMKYVWKCMSKRYEHPMTSMINDGANRFIKKVYTALYPSDQNKAVGLAVVTYEWIGREPFDFNVVGNVARPSRKPHPRVPPSGSWETSSFQNSVTAVLPSTMNRFFGDIPMYAVGAVDFNTAASIILGGTVVEPSKVAQQVPQGYREAGTFVIDTEAFPSDAYLRRDNNGVWGKPAGTSRYYAIDEPTGDAIRIDNGNKLPTAHTHDIQILCKRYEHPAVEGRFVRKIYTGRPGPGPRAYQQRTHVGVLVYYWKGEPEYFEVTRQNQVTTVDRRYMIDEFESIDHHNLPVSPRRRNGAPHPAKRRKEESSMNNRLPMDMGESDSDKEFRNAAWKKEYENQMRFSALLDRAEAFLCRLERASGNVLYTQDNPEPQQEWVQRANADDGINNEQVQYND